MKVIRNFALAVLWAVVSFTFVFFIIPSTMIATPDILWISLCIAVPVLLALYMFNKNGIHSGFILVGLAVQVLLMLLLQGYVAGQWGISLSGLGAFEYISLFAYPVAQTAISFILLKITHKKAE